MREIFSCRSRMYPRVTKIFWSRSLNTQESLRLLQPSHGWDPEHLIFCLRHRTQLRKVSDYDSRVALRFPGFSSTYAFGDRLATRGVSPAMSVVGVMAANTETCAGCYYLQSGGAITAESQGSLSSLLESTGDKRRFGRMETWSTAPNRRCWLITFLGILL